MEQPHKGGAAAISSLQLLYHKVHLLYQGQRCYIKGRAAISRAEQLYPVQSSYIKCRTSISSEDLIHQGQYRPGAEAAGALINHTGSPQMCYGIRGRPLDSYTPMDTGARDMWLSHGG